MSRCIWTSDVQGQTRESQYNNTDKRKVEMKKSGLILLAIVAMSVIIFDALALAQIQIVSDSKLIDVGDSMFVRRKALIISSSLLSFEDFDERHELLKKCGYSSVICEFQGGTKEELRSFIDELYEGDNRLEEVEFAGNEIPVVFLEGKRDGRIESYPSDWYYSMYPTVKFLDVCYGETIAGNGVFDSWHDPAGKYEMRINVSRIPVNVPYAGSPEWIFQNNLRKLYAAHEKENSGKAFVAADDYFLPDNFRSAMASIFGRENVLLRKDGDPMITGGNAVTKEKILRILATNEYNVSILMSHGGILSSLVYKYFHEEPQNVAYYDFIDKYPRSQIYMLNMCSVGNFSADNFLAGALVSGKDYGLAAFASSATNWGLPFGGADSLFYKLLKQGESLGAAFRKQYNQESQGVAPESLWWCYTDKLIVGFSEVNVYLRYPRPDLAIEWKKLPPPPPPPSREGFLSKEIVIKNEGYVPSRRTSLGVYTQKGDDAPVLIEERSIGRMKPKKRKTLELEIPVEKLPTLPCRLIVKVDPENGLLEENEGNNRVVAVVK